MNQTRTRPRRRLSPAVAGPAAALLAAFATAFTASPEGRAQDAPFDLVVAGGRVVDPETGLDGIRDVGIRDGTIAAISERSLSARDTIDARGLVVAPGFIDLHAHGQDAFSSRLQAQDGVTTALELEGGAGDIDAWYAARAGKALIHYGASTSHGSARGRAVGGQQAGVRDAASVEQLALIESRLRDELGRGALGIGYGIQYTPGARREEIFRLFQVAADEGVTNFVHIRYAGQVEPGSSIEAVHEMIGNAAATGASVHIVHIGSSGLRQAPTLLAMIDGARARGLDVSTEVYPYTAASTDIRSAIFDPGWRERLGADYGDIEWGSTGERLTAESFGGYRERGGTLIAHIIPEEVVETALVHPGVIVASDGVGFVNGRAHPRGAGTFARVLGRYVRERGILSLTEALEKMTLLPARRLESYVAGMRAKGRVQVGADADLTAFDPATVIDNATFEGPARASSGVLHVIVAGTPVVRGGVMQENIFPGEAVRREH